MAKASDNVFPRVIYGMNTADQAAPADSSWRVYSKANGIFARSSNAVVGPFGATGSVSLTTVDATLSGTVTMTNANQLYDGPSASFTAGTWLVTWKIAVLTAGTNTHQIAGRLWDGSTIYDESQTDMASIAANFIISVIGTAIVTLGGTATLKLSASDIRASSVMQRDVNAIAGGAGSNHTATRMVGVKIA